MTTFDEREKSFEAKFLHDEELRFRVLCRRNKLLGLWAAELMGMRDDAADAYAAKLVTTEFGIGGHSDVHDKVFADLHAQGVDLSDHRLRRKMDQLLGVAQQQVMTEPGPLAAEGLRVGA